VQQDGKGIGWRGGRLGTMTTREKRIVRIERPAKKLRRPRSPTSGQKTFGTKIYQGDSGGQRQCRGVRGDFAGLGVGGGRWGEN